MCVCVCGGGGRGRVYRVYMVLGLQGSSLEDLGGGGWDKVCVCVCVAVLGCQACVRCSTLCTWYNIVLYDMHVVRYCTVYM